VTKKQREKKNIFEIIFLTIFSSFAGGLRRNNINGA
jgi:hypothetical protein